MQFIRNEGKITNNVILEDVEIIVIEKASRRVFLIESSESWGKLSLEFPFY